MAQGNTTACTDDHISFIVQCYVEVKKPGPRKWADCERTESSGGTAGQFVNSPLLSAGTADKTALSEPDSVFARFRGESVRAHLPDVPDRRRIHTVNLHIGRVNPWSCKPCLVQFEQISCCHKGRIYRKSDCTWPQMVTANFNRVSIVDEHQHDTGVSLDVDIPLNGGPRDALFDLVSPFSSFYILARRVFIGQLKRHFKKSVKILKRRTSMIFEAPQCHQEQEVPFYFWHQQTVRESVCSAVCICG